MDPKGRVTKTDATNLRLSRQLDIATTTMNDLLEFKLDPNKPAAEMVRMKMKIRKAFDDIRKLESNGTDHSTGSGIQEGR